MNIVKKTIQLNLKQDKIGQTCDVISTVTAAGKI